MIAVADAGDKQFDSAILIGKGTLTFGASSTCLGKNKSCHSKPTSSSSSTKKCCSTLLCRRQRSSGSSRVCLPCIAPQCQMLGRWRLLCRQGVPQCARWWDRQQKMSFLPLQPSSVRRQHRLLLEVVRHPVKRPESVQEQVVRKERRSGSDTLRQGSRFGRGTWTGPNPGGNLFVGRN